MLYISGFLYYVFRFSGYLIVISTHYKNEFDTRGQLFNKFLSYIQFAVCLSFFVLSIKSLFVENWDFFLLNSGLMILSGLAALKGLSSFKLKDYTLMRNSFFQTEGLAEHNLNFVDEDEIFQPGNSRPRFPDSGENDAQLQRSVLQKFHNLYTDSVIKEVILRSQLQFKMQLEKNSKQKTFISDAYSEKSKILVEEANLPAKSEKTQDSLVNIIGDGNVNKLSKQYMNVCGLDISFGSVDRFDEPLTRTKKIVQKYTEIDSD